MKPARPTALISGASKGLGLEFAWLFAAEGYNLVLVARTEALLLEISTSITRQFGVTVRIFAFDLSLPESVEHIAKELEIMDIHIDVLVNNAGFAQWGPYYETDAEVEEKMIQLNILALTRLTKKILPGMVSRKSGKILNLGSVAAFQPGPYMAVYFATKAFVLSFSEALSAELSGSGITVSCLCPGPVQTEFVATAGLENNRIFKKSNLADARKIARFGFKSLMNGRVVAIPGWRHNLSVFAIRFVPRFLVRAVLKQIQ